MITNEPKRDDPTCFSTGLTESSGVLDESAIRAMANSIFAEMPAALTDHFSASMQARDVPDARELLRAFMEPPAGIYPAAGLAPGESLYFLPPENLAGDAHPLQNLDVAAIRRDFPILHQLVHGKPLIWLDNAATSQKPQQVIDVLSRYYRTDNSNIHRGAHELADRATDAYEEAREKARGFLGAGSTAEIIFVRGATEAVNLVAQSYGCRFINAGDEIIISEMEHHANIVPWQLLAQQKGAVLRMIPIDDNGVLLLDAFEKLLGPRTRLVAITQVSNVLGTVNNLAPIIAVAHHAGARVLVDGAQAVPHMPVNVQHLDADFYVLSGHKMLGPTGIGVLFGKKELLEEMPPWQGGGNMIDTVSMDKTTYAALPAKFEAGTGNIGDAVGLGAAIDYLNRIGRDNIQRYEHSLTEYAMGALSTIPGLRHIGASPSKVSVLSFTIPGVPYGAIGSYLNREGIAVRAGHHCAQPVHRHFGLTGTVRPSLAFYNTPGEIDQLVAALHRGLPDLRGA